MCSFFFSSSVSRSLFFLGVVLFHLGTPLLCCYSLFHLFSFFVLSFFPSSSLLRVIPCLQIMLHGRPGVSQNLDHWRRMPKEILTDPDFADRISSRPIQTKRVDEQSRAGVSDSSRLFGGLSPFWNRSPAEERKVETGSRDILRQKKLNMRRTPVPLNVPIPLGRVDYPGDRFRFAEFIPSFNTSILPAQYKTVVIDNEVQTGVQYPTDEALYMELPRSRLTFVDLMHPRSRESRSRVTVLASINKVNELLYKHPAKYNSAATVIRSFGFLGTVDGIVAGSDQSGYSRDTSMINMHVGGEGACKVDNIWLGYKGRLRQGTTVYLVLVRKTYPQITSIHDSVLMATDLMGEDGVIPDDESKEDGKGLSQRKIRSSYPPDGCKYYWRFEPFASNDSSIWDPPPLSAYEGEGWCGLYISLGVIKDILGTVTGEKGKHDNDIVKSLYPHEHATHHQGAPPKLPLCTLVLAY